MVCYAIVVAVKVPWLTARLTKRKRLAMQTITFAQHLSCMKHQKELFLEKDVWVIPFVKN